MGDNRGVGFIGTNLKQTKGSHLAVSGDIYPGGGLPYVG